MDHVADLVHHAVSSVLDDRPHGRCITRAI